MPKPQLMNSMSVLRFTASVVVRLGLVLVTGCVSLPNCGSPQGCAALPDAADGGAGYAGSGSSGAGTGAAGWTGTDAGQDAGTDAVQDVGLDAGMDSGTQTIELLDVSAADYLGAWEAMLRAECECSGTVHLDVCHESTKGQRLCVATAIVEGTKAIVDGAQTHANCAFDGYGNTRTCIEENGCSGEAIDACHAMWDLAGCHELPGNVQDEVERCDDPPPECLPAAPEEEAPPCCLVDVTNLGCDGTWDCEDGFDEDDDCVYSN